MFEPMHACKPPCTHPCTHAGGNGGGNAWGRFTEGGFFGRGRFNLLERVRLVLAFFMWSFFMSMIVRFVVKLALKAVALVPKIPAWPQDEETEGSTGQAAVGDLPGAATGAAVGAATWHHLSSEGAGSSDPTSRFMDLVEVGTVSSPSVSPLSSSFLSGRRRGRSKGAEGQEEAGLGAESGSGPRDAVAVEVGELDERSHQAYIEMLEQHQGGGGRQRGEGAGNLLARYLAILGSVAFFAHPWPK